MSVNYFTLHRSDISTRANALDPLSQRIEINNLTYHWEVLLIRNVFGLEAEVKKSQLNKSIIPGPQLMREL